MEVQYHDLIKIGVLFPAIPCNFIVLSPTHIQSMQLLALSYLLQPIGHIHVLSKFGGIKWIIHWHHKITCAKFPINLVHPFLLWTTRNGEKGDYLYLYFKTHGTISGLRFLSDQSKGLMWSVNALRPSLLYYCGWRDFYHLIDNSPP